MEEVRSEFVHTAPPIANEQLLPISTEQLLYHTYSARVSDFAGFRQRAFAEARADFVKTIHEATDGTPPEVFRPIIQNIITPESYDELKTELSNYWKEHGLERDLENYSYCILTNHRFFSDLPICAAVVRDIRHSDPNAASRNILIVGKMIPTMEVDIDQSGQYGAVTPLLALAARQLQSVPGLPDQATKEMKAQRLIWNNEFKQVFNELAATPGNIIFEAGSGTHDKVTDKGSRLTMQHINLETARLLCNQRLKVIPIFFSCDSFSDQGLEPAEAKYKLLEPRIFTEPEEVHNTMREIAAAGAEKLSKEFPNGVVYAETWREKARKLGRGVTGRASEIS